MTTSIGTVSRVTALRKDRVSCTSIVCKHGPTRDALGLRRCGVVSVSTPYDLMADAGDGLLRRDRRDSTMNLARLFAPLLHVIITASMMAPSLAFRLSSHSIIDVWNINHGADICCLCACRSKPKTARFFAVEVLGIGRAAERVDLRATHAMMLHIGYHLTAERVPFRFRRRYTMVLG